MNLNVNNINGQRLWFKNGVIDNLSVCKLNGKNVGEKNKIKTKITFISTNSTINSSYNYVVINSISGSSSSVSLESPGCNHSVKIKNETQVTITIYGIFSSSQSVTLTSNNSVECVFSKDNKYWITF